MTTPASLQIQAVLYKNEPHELIRALESLVNAVRYDRENSRLLGEVFFCFGDASPEPIFNNTDIDALNQRFGDLIRGQRTNQHRIDGSFLTPTLNATPGDLALVIPKRQLDDIIETEQSNSPYIPMCEMRYVVGEAIALTVYDKYCQANNSRFKLIRDKKVNEILSSVINLNNNLHNIESLKPSNSDANNKIDIITDYFQIDRLEKLLEHRTEEILNKEKNNC